MRQYDRSLDLYARTKKVSPMAAQTMSKAPGRVGPIGAFPLYLQSAHGAYVTDVDNNTFVDWFNGNCAVVLGHSHYLVTSTIESALAQYGSLPSLPTPLEADVAEQLCEHIPCAESVRFLKTGSEATEAAVRIARCATGRELILTLQGHYHGWHSQWQSPKPDHPGVPSFYGAGIQACSSFDFIPGGNVAAVILEPCLLDPTSHEDLQGIVDRAHEAGALVIFDEMITGIRWGLGGYQQHIGVTPDLATFGKAYANGHPFAFVCGRADLMQHAHLVSGTFGGEVAGLAACHAVLTLGATSLDNLRRAGHVLKQVLTGLPLPWSVVGSDVRFACHWHADLPHRDAVIALWQQELAEHGVLVHPSAWNPSAAHDDAAVATTMIAVLTAAEIVQAAIATNTIADRLRGPVLTPAFGRPAA